MLHMASICGVTDFDMQVGSRAERMGLAGMSNMYLYSETRLHDILAAIISMRPKAVIIDSIQTVYLDHVTGSAGSVSQAGARLLSACTHVLLQHITEPC